jgi:hypothetical protein
VGWFREKTVGGAAEDPLDTVAYAAGAAADAAGQIDEKGMFSVYGDT